MQIVYSNSGDVRLKLSFLDGMPIQSLWEQTTKTSRMAGPFLTSASVQDTQKQLLEYIKQNCQNFEAFADQCAAYIDLYGPLVINMAKSYLKPTLCSQLGFCPKASDSISAS